MSAETMEWLNTRTLIGFTGKRGNAWHYRAEVQGTESNHYADGIPVADVRRRLFGWELISGDVSSTVIDADGVSTYADPNRKAIIRPRGTFGADDPGAILGVFKDGYQPHQYDAWLVENVETILDEGLQVASAGLLKGGAVAWVQVELPETCSVLGLDYRPFLTAATSCDGSLATRYMLGIQAVVCDNTLSAAVGGADTTVKIKHSRKSLGRIGDVREALQLVHQVSEDFDAQVRRLSDVTVSDDAWKRFLEAHAPTMDRGTVKSGRSLTMAQNTQDTLNRLWRLDPRVQPWAGTAFGVVQAVNTYTHHEGIVRGASRVERNALRMVSGGVDTLDQGTLDTLLAVL